MRIFLRSGVQRSRYLSACLLLLSLSGCGKSDLGPVDLRPEDICANCKMAISERAFAAEILNREEIAIKFDDIGCLVHYISNRTKMDEISAWFVTDYPSKTWIDATKASYIRSNTIRTPMGSGIVAYREKSQAKAAAAQAGLQVQAFSEILH